MKPVILFDLDGVIADSWESFFKASCPLMGTLGLEHLSKPETILEMFEGNFILNLLKEMHPRALTPDLQRQLSDVLKQVMEGCSPFDGIQQALSALAEQHTLFLVTSNDTEAARSFLNVHQLNYFEEIVGSDKEPSKIRKINTIQQRFPEQSLYYVGDTLGDLLEASAANAIPVAAGWGWHDKATLMKGNPAYYLQQPSELPQYFASLA